ncbi:motile sperm domain-containing protein 2-like [Tetranychus urticae]|uniref:CRAL-TRIO domain-containing protein n=1 Tax=Tetranychus urticae TaxID=32264 RepID=T1JR70_TETUR|nr:motile sperm domain-containing protein 2-like [Tetranychus urticae]
MEPSDLKKSIEKLRKAFLDLSDEDQFDARDIKLVKSSDIPCISFLETNSSLSKALETLVKHCQWRKKEHINDLKATDFPAEVFRLGWLYHQGSDLDGHPLMWMRLKVPLGPRSLLLKYFTYSLEVVRNRTLADEIKPAVIYDCRNPSIDINALKELVHIGLNQYPPWIEYIVFLEMSSTFAFFCRAARYFFPKHLRDHVKFMSASQLESLISLDNFPDYMGGKITTIDTPTLQQCPSFSSFAETQKLDKSEIESIQRYFDENIGLKENLNNPECAN